MDKAPCFKFLLEKANSGDLEAMYNVAWCYREGLGTPRDFKLAVQWFRKRAQEENNEWAPEALLCAASIYEKNLYSPSQAAPLYAKILLSPFSSSSALSAAREGLRRFANRDPSLAGASDSAILDYFKAYPFGTNLLVRVGDVSEERLESLREAAAAGNGDAAHALGLCYERGWGVKKSYTEAHLWQTRAALNHSAKAFYALGRMVEQGLGTAADWKEAGYGYRRGGEEGDLDAREALIRLYREKMGPEVSFEEARLWQTKGYPGLAFRKFVEQ